MNIFEELAQRYLATWNETDPTARRRALDELYIEDARYVDPLAGAEGERRSRPRSARCRRSSPATDSASHRCRGDGSRRRRS